MKIKEILVLHHSHFDVGYTHTQPILWELQREFIDGALEMLDQTRDFPEYARPRWTCEVTAQVLKWLRSASPESVDKFHKYAQEKRIGISAMLCHTTPLANAEQLMRQLYPIKQLREQFGIAINTLNQHDINGVPWALADIMLDCGIDLFVMAINRHLGGYATERPAVIRWETPSGRTIRVMNGAHYTMFDQLFDTHLHDLDTMEKGIENYIDFLKNVKHYRHDFIYLTTANAPVCYDNSPPNIDVAKLIRDWNAAGRQPLIRYVTPEQLLERIDQVPNSEMPVYSGDWTDFWNFGCASNAEITKTNLHAKPRLLTRDLIAATRGNEHPAIREVARRAWWHLNFYDEHTWGSYNSMIFDNSFARTQANIKDGYAYKARELADYLAIDALESLAENPAQANHQDGILLVNNTPATRTELIPVPEHWSIPGKRLRTARFGWNNRYEYMNGAPLFGPVELPPYSWKKIPFGDLQKAPDQPKIETGDIEIVGPELHNINIDTVMHQPKFIESDVYRLEFDLATGRINRLFDKKNNWEVFDRDSEWTFFEFAHESPDALVDSGRTAYYRRNLTSEKFDVQCWQTEWKARRQKATKPLSCNVETHPHGMTLVTKFAAPGCEWIEQRVTLLADSPRIELTARIMKSDIRTAENIYFVFPLNLPEGWRSHFDTAGIPVELDAEQLPGASRDWVTVESFAAVHTPTLGATLFCPDAPMVQIGGFNFGKISKSVEKPANPLLLAWPMSSFWDTNFRPSQPGLTEIRYVFRSHGAFDAVSAIREGKAVASPVEVHPAIDCPKLQSGKFFELSGEAFEVLHVKPAEDGSGAIFRLINHGKKTANCEISVPGRKLSRAALVNPLEEFVATATTAGNAAKLSLEPRKITSLKLEYAATNGQVTS